MEQTKIVKTGCELTPRDQENVMLEKISLSDILERDIPMYSGTLIINPPSRPMMAINCGDPQGFVRMTHEQNGVRGIMWSETDVALILDDRHTVIRYSPEMHPHSALFFEKSNKRTNDDDNLQVWEGEFKPVQFTKQNLLKFLKMVEIADVPKDVIDAIRNMKVSERKKQEDSISLDEDTTKMVYEESLSTNIPKRFSLMLPVSEEYIGKFEFEAQVAKKKDRYGSEDPHKKVIELRCLNGQQVLRDRMTQILNQLPPEIPKYYGRMLVSGGNRDEHW